MFANDRDLIILEPRLFFDVLWTAQRLVDSATGGAINAAGDTLTITAGNLINLNITGGMIALVAGSPLEVIDRIDATNLRISRLRAAESDALIPAAQGSALKVTIHTFRPQVQVIHDQLLRSFGIEPAISQSPGGTPEPQPASDSLTESAITNPRAFSLAEALGTLHLVYTSAAAVVGGDSPMWAKALMYRDRYAAERRRIVAEIDLNNDGEPDTTRRTNIFQFTRA
jgi:hypothetical protein